MTTAAQRVAAFLEAWKQGPLNGPAIYSIWRDNIEHELTVEDLEFLVEIAEERS